MSEMMCQKVEKVKKMNFGQILKEIWPSLLSSEILSITLVLLKDQHTLQLIIKCQARHSVQNLRPVKMSGFL